MNELNCLLESLTSHLKQNLDLLMLSQIVDLLSAILDAVDVSLDFCINDLPASSPSVSKLHQIINDDLMNYLFEDAFHLLSSDANAMLDVDSLNLFSSISYLHNEVAKIYLTSSPLISSLNKSDMSDLEFILLKGLIVMSSGSNAVVDKFSSCFSKYSDANWVE